MKILLTVDNYPPFEHGGSGVSTYLTAKGLKELGCDVYVFSLRMKNLGRDKFPILEPILEYLRDGMEKEGCRDKLFMKAVWYDNPLFYQRIYQELNKLIESGKFDVVHANDSRTPLFSVYLALKHNIPAMTTIRDYSVLCFSHSAFSNGRMCKKCTPLDMLTCSNHDIWLKEILMPYYQIIHSIRKKLISGHSKIVTTSKYMKQFLENLGYKRTTVIYNPVELFPISENKSQRKQILYLARFSKEKGLDVLIRAIPLILKEVPQTSFLIISNVILSKLPEDCRKIIREYTKRIRFKAWVNRETLHQLYSESMLTVITSLWNEPFGRTVAESFAHKKTVVASNVGGIPELVQGRGLLFEKGNSEDLALKILRLINDHAFREKLENKAYEFAKKELNYIKIAKKYLHEYEKLV